jgi:hypothetical protein
VTASRPRKFNVHNLFQKKQSAAPGGCEVAVCMKHLKPKVDKSAPGKFTLTAVLILGLAIMGLFAGCTSIHLGKLGGDW